MNLYKYYSPDSVDFILVDHGVSVRFSQPEILNDPFEVKPQDSHGFIEDPIRALKDLVSDVNNKLSTPEEIKEILLSVDGSIENQKSIHKKINERVGVFSLSRRKSSSAMWSYYSNDHRGFVVEYKDAITLEKNIKDKINGCKKFEGQIIHADVEYEFERRKFIDASIEDLIKNQIFFKDKDWTHEEEYRFFLDLKNLKSSRYDSMGFAIHNVVLDPSVINRVILGYRASETLKRKVLLWSKNVAKDVVISQATLSISNYELEYDPIYERSPEQELLFVPSALAD